MTSFTESTLIWNMRVQSSGSDASTEVEPEGAARIVDEGVHRTGRGDVVAERIDLRGVREIGDEDLRSGLRGERLQPVTAPRDGDDLPAVVAEQADRRRTDP